MYRAFLSLIAWRSGQTSEWLEANVGVSGGLPLHRHVAPIRRVPQLLTADIAHGVEEDRDKTGRADGGRSYVASYLVVWQCHGAGLCSRERMG